MVMRKEAKICWTWPKTYWAKGVKKCDKCGMWETNTERHSQHLIDASQTRLPIGEEALPAPVAGSLSYKLHSRHVITVWITCHTFAPATFSKKTQAEAENNWHGRGTEPQFQCPAQDWQANRPEANTAHKPRHSIFAPKSADCLECNASSTWHHHELTVWTCFIITQTLCLLNKTNPQDPQQDKAANASQLVTFRNFPQAAELSKKKRHLLGPLAKHQTTRRGWRECFPGHKRGWRPCKTGSKPINFTKDRWT